MVLLFVDSILRSILVGSLFTLVAIGITQTFAVTRIANFAHGELVTVGAYLGAITTKFLSFPLGLIVGIVISFVASAALITSIDEAVFKPLTRRGASPLMLMVASFAVSMGIRYSLYVAVVSQKILTVMSEISVQNVYTIGDGAITNLFIWVVPTTLACVFALEFMFVSTKTGKAMRAVFENVSLAAATGINVNQIRRLTWIIGGGLAGVAGSFWAIFSQTTPEVGWSVLLRGFAASTIGGLSSFSGTIVGGYIIGLSENLVMDMLNRYLGLDMVYKPTIMFGIMIAFLMFKPRGLVLEYTNIRENVQRILKMMSRSVEFGSRD
jgi:branched-subunit amino acid ABC-type transport system permease component